MDNYEQTLISQYGTSPTLTQLIENMNGYIDPLADLQTFYDYVWNVETAQGFGLDIWGKIVDVERNYKIPAQHPFFGFDDSSDDYRGFGQAPLYVGSGNSQVFALPDSAYRTLILVKALSNISDGTIPAYNQLITNLFKNRGIAFVSDLGGMRIQYTFTFYLAPAEIAILLQSNALPSPSGVRATAIQIYDKDTLGFKEAGDYQPFGYGIFRLNPIVI